MSYITFKNVNKEYLSGENSILAANDCSFEIEKGELCVVLGPSGAGKTTVLNLLGGMDRVTSGTITVDTKDISKLNENGLADYRRIDVGFVFQFYNLMPTLTALENVELARQICSNSLDPKEILANVGLKDRMHNFPAQLSGGEQQRVSIARALCKNSTLLLCDEPTGALDSKTGLQILHLLNDVSEKMHKTVVIITHNSLITPIAHRVIRMKNGSIEAVETNNSSTPVEAIEW